MLAEFDIVDTEELEPLEPPKRLTATPSAAAGRRGRRGGAFWNAGVEPLAAEPVATPTAAVATTAADPILSDLLILYTPEALTATGSLEALMADAVGAMDKANAAYKNSAINLQLNTVGVRQVRIDVDLNNLANDDGQRSGIVLQLQQPAECDAEARAALSSSMPTNNTIAASVPIDCGATCTLKAANMRLVLTENTANGPQPFLFKRDALTQPLWFVHCRLITTALDGMQT